MTELQPPLSTLELVDAGLRCPSCSYNLTGLNDQRCPECGAVYDPDELRLILQGHPRPVPGWDDQSKPSARAFFVTCARTWFHPMQFGRHFPANYHRRTAMRFRVWTFAVALGIYFLEVSLAVRALPLDVLGIIGASVVGVVVGVFTCEFLLLGFFSLTMKRRIATETLPDGSGSHSWRGVIGYYRSSLIISALLVGPAVVWFQNEVGSWLAIALTITWWWICLGTSSYVMAKPGGGRLLGIMSIPIAAAAAIFVGFWASAPFAIRFIRFN